MKNLALITILNLFLFNVVFGQDHERYSELVKEAWTLYEAKEYLKSGQKYNEAFIALGGKGFVNDRYNAACSWALSNEIDSAFVQLFKIAENASYSNLSRITTDTDLNVLYQDERWKQVIEKVRVNKEKAEANLDKYLVAILDTVFEDDQRYRRQIDEIEEKYGRDSEEVKTH